MLLAFQGEPLLLTVTDVTLPEMVFLPVQPHPLNRLEDFRAESAPETEAATVIPGHMILVALPAVELRLEVWLTILFLFSRIFRAEGKIGRFYYFATKLACFLFAGLGAKGLAGWYLMV